MTCPSCYSRWRTTSIHQVAGMLRCRFVEKRGAQAAIATDYYNRTTARFPAKRLWRHRKKKGRRTRQRCHFQSGEPPGFGESRHGGVPDAAPARSKSQDPQGAPALEERVSHLVRLDATAVGEDDLGDPGFRQPPQGLGQNQHLELVQLCSKAFSRRAGRKGGELSLGSRPGNCPQGPPRGE